MRSSYFGWGLKRGTIGTNTIMLAAKFVTLFCSRYNSELMRETAQVNLISPFRKRCRAIQSANDV